MRYKGQGARHKVKETGDRRQEDEVASIRNNSGNYEFGKGRLKRQKAQSPGDCELAGSRGRQAGS